MVISPWQRDKDINLRLYVFQRTGSSPARQRWRTSMNNQVHHIEEWGRYCKLIRRYVLCMCVWGGSWGADGGWMPLPTRPQRYCDPASLVTFDTTSLDRSELLLPLNLEKLLEEKFSNFQFKLPQFCCAKSWFWALVCWKLAWDWLNYHLLCQIVCFLAFLLGSCFISLPFPNNEIGLKWQIIAHELLICCTKGKNLRFNKIILYVVI